VKGETNQREGERDWWLGLDGNVEVKWEEKIRDHTF
jgi:hypothetical protein